MTCMSLGFDIKVALPLWLPATLATLIVHS